MKQIIIKIKNENTDKVTLTNEKGRSFLYSPNDDAVFHEFIMASIPNKKIPSIDYAKMLAYLNSCTGRQFKVINEAVRKKMRARLKEGYSKKDFVNAIRNACQSEYHRENGFQHLTPEFFSRSATLDKYGSVVNNSTKVVQKPQENFKNNIPVE